MKYFAVFLVAVVVIIGLNFVLPDTDESKLPELKISAYVFCDDTITAPYDSGQDAKYCFKELEVGNTLLLASVNSPDVFNLCFTFEFSGGIIEMTSKDKDVQLSTSELDLFNSDAAVNQRKFGFSMSCPDGGYINANPSGSGGGFKIIDETILSDDGYPGREYLLNVSAYEFADEAHPVITAALKLTQLRDINSGRGQSGVAYYSVELVSVEYGDKYQMILDSQD